MHAALWLSLLLHAPVAPEAGVRRYALIVGANEGTQGDAPLRYAFDDAKQMAATLRDLGGFDPRDTLLLDNPDADSVRRGFAELQTRMARDKGVESLLLVYYSGHADALALHMRRTTLAWTDLLALANHSAAAVRVVILDACRSGEATALKGSQAVPHAASNPADTSLPRGLAVISSASADEAAQESRRLRGSFFTYHLLSALRGAGDLNADGRISLTEAFQYSADSTAQSTARTVAGVQHATYRYNLRGRSDVALTMPGQAAGRVALQVTAAGDYTFRRAGAQGSASAPVVLAASLEAGPHALWLPPGRYLVQRRTAAALYEGTIDVQEPMTALPPEALEALPLEALALKGSVLEADAVDASDVELSAWGGSGAPLVPHMPMPAQFGLLLTVPWQRLRFDAQLQVGSANAKNSSTVLQQLDVGAVVGARFVVLEAGPTVLSAGLRAGALYVAQSAPGLSPRWLLAPQGQALVRFDIQLSAHFFAGLEVATRLAGMRQQESNTLTVALQPLGSLGVGARW